MKISRITNYRELKQEKARLKEELEISEALIKADVAAIKSTFSVMGIIRNAGGLLLAGNTGGATVMNSGFKLGMQVIPFLFRRKKRKGGIKNIIIENAVVAVAPKLVALASNALASLISKTTPHTQHANYNGTLTQPATDTSPVLKTTAIEAGYPVKK